MAEEYLEQTIEPRLQDFGLEPESYLEYEKRKEALTKEVKSLEVSNALIFWIIAPIIFVILLGFHISFWISIGVAFFLGGLACDFDLAEKIANFRSQGRYSKLQGEIHRLTEDFFTKIRPFERAYKTWTERSLEEFYETKLFRKRSANEEFQSNLRFFSEWLHDIDKINLIFKAERIQTAKFERYLHGRLIDVSFVKNGQKPIPWRTRLLDQYSLAQKVFKDPPPEKLYASPRTVDWEALNQKKKITGNKGEELVMALENEYLTSAGRPDLASKIERVSLQADWHGYDVLSFNLNGEEKYIEVKSTTSSMETPFYLSSNELLFLQSHTETAFIYRVSDVDRRPTLHVFPATEVLGSSSLTPVSYLVRMSNLTG